MDNIAILKTLKDGLANILLTSSKTTDELDKKIISLVNAINKAIDVSTPRVRLYSKSVPRFDEECKGAQIRVRRLKKI